MFDRTQQGRDTAPLNQSVPSLGSRHNEHLNTNVVDPGTADESTSAKPALTERERRERWPVD